MSFFTIAFVHLLFGAKIISAYSTPEYIVAPNTASDGPTPHRAALLSIIFATRESFLVLSRDLLRLAPPFHGLSLHACIALARMFDESICRMEKTGCGCARQQLRWKRRINKKKKS